MPESWLEDHHLSSGGGFVGLSTIRLLKDTGVTGGTLKKATKELAEEAEKGSFWLWLRRKDKCWGKNT